MLFFRKIRFFWNLIKAFLRKHYLVFLGSLVLGIILFFFIVKIAPFLIDKIPELKKTQKIGVVGKYTQEELPIDILNLISQGLTQTLEDGSVQPALAESWTVEEEGKKYSFQLKDNIFWQDGTPITSDDINYKFSGLEKEVIDEKNLSFRLLEPFSPFLNVVSVPVFKKNLIGVGPYRVKKIGKAEGVVRSLVLSGPGKQLIFRFYPTLETATTGFKLGEIDILKNVLDNPFPDNWQTKLTIEETVKDNQFIGLFFNTQDPNLGDKTLRQALSYALKKDYPNRALTSLSLKSWAFNPEVKTYDFSPEKAREFFEKSRGEDEEPLTLELATPETFLQEAEEIKKSWQEILGIQTNIKIINSLSPDFQVLLTALEVPLDPDQYTLWHSTQPSNITRFQSPKIDKLLEDGRKILDQAKRKEKYFDFQRFLSEELPVLFLYHPTVYTIRRK